MSGVRSAARTAPRHTMGAARAAALATLVALVSALSSRLALASTTDVTATALIV